MPPKHCPLRPTPQVRTRLPVARHAWACARDAMEIRHLEPPVVSPDRSVVYAPSRVEASGQVIANPTTETTLPADACPARLQPHIQTSGSSRAVPISHKPQSKN